MSRHSIKDWFLATRPWSFPVSVIPVVATFAFEAASQGGFASLSVIDFFLALIGMVLFHCAGNLISDWNDHRTGVDNERAYAVPNLVFKHFTPKEYLVYGIVLLVLGAAVGFWLVFRCAEPMQLLIIGGIGFLLTVLYSFFKGKALGEVVIFANFAVLPMLGTSLVVSGALDYRSIFLAVPIGLVTVGVLYINNIRDRQTDREAGLHTFVMWLQSGAALGSYLAFIMLPMLLVVGSVVAGIFPYATLISLVALFPAYKIFLQVKEFKTKGNKAILTLDQQTAQLQMIFGLTLTLGLFAGIWL